MESAAGLLLIKKSQTKEHVHFINLKLKYLYIYTVIKIVLQVC